MYNLNEIKEKALSIKEELINIRRDFHMHPELGMSENRTMNKISEYLKELNISHKTKVANTGVIADIEGEDKSFTVAFRGDIDALPLDDLKTCSYASKEKGKCHACGHDVHNTVVVGIAKMFSSIKPPCNIRLIFQPAEESVGGALPMIKEGALEKVNVIYGLHVASDTNIGDIKLTYGVMNASCSDFFIKVYGKSAHGAHPSEGIDAIIAGNQIISAMQTIVSRSVDPLDSAVVTIGTINGGKVENIICDYLEIRGTIRALKDSTMEFIKNRIKDIVQNIPKSLGARGEFVETVHFDSLINWDEAVDIVKKNAETLIGKEHVKDNIPALGVEDFAFFVQKSPGAFFNLGTRNESKGITAAAHHGLFDIDENAIETGVILQVMNAYESYAQKDKFPLGKKR